MNTPPTPTVERTDKETEKLFCDECGKGDAVRFGDRILCIDCYAQSGACCADQFGGDEHLLIHEQK